MYHESIDSDWENFLNPQESVSSSICNDEMDTNVVPKCDELYISTQTKIAYLERCDSSNKELLDLNALFWKIPITKYEYPCEGIIKKQIKVTTTTKKEFDEIETKLKNEDVYSTNVIMNVKSDKPDEFKHVQKLSIGLSKKDILSSRVKQKGAFYNCFVMIFRIQCDKGKFCEVHVKLFNTGKLEIPGMKHEGVFYKTLDILVDIVSKYYEENFICKKSNVTTVLINSNFNCGFYVNRDVLYTLLRNKYNIIAVYDPCSYPGIQCKFYYNSNKLEQNGRCECVNRCCKKKNVKYNCQEISYMVFRTGSVLIVGRTTEEIIRCVYNFLKDVFASNYKHISVKSTENVKEKKQQRIIKKQVLIKCNPSR